MRWKNEHRDTLIVTIKATPEMVKVAQLTLDVQDACNIVAVAGRFAEVLKTLNRSEQNKLGSVYVRQHPITQLWVDKLEHLAGMEQSSATIVYGRVADLAEGQDIKAEFCPTGGDLEFFWNQGLAIADPR